MKKTRWVDLTYKELIDQHVKILKQLRFKSGLFSASKPTVSTGYDKAWLRDNFYECMAFEAIRDWETVRKTYRALLDIFLKHEDKITAAIMQKPEYTHQYIHARYNPETFDEFWEEWGNKQNDAVGCILFKIGELEKVKGIKILENEADYRITQKLVDYLSTLEYWHDPDSGIWEEEEEVHASSIGACVAGLEMISDVKGIEVHPEIIKKGRAALRKLLPRESDKKFVDLALLSLIWPYEVTTKRETKEILQNVEYHLLKNRGIIRYKGDAYYNKNLDNFSEEAEWTFGLSWLSIIYSQIGKPKLAKKFIKKAIETINEQGEVPELYYSNTEKNNANSPLGWSESLLVTALYEMNHKHLDLKHPGKKSKTTKKSKKKASKKNGKTKKKK